MVELEGSSNSNELVKLNEMAQPPMANALCTDVVMDIVMSHLKARDLLACRGVCKCWNKTVSSVLRRRSTMMRYNNMATLNNIAKRMKENPEFPFAGLRFDDDIQLRFAGSVKFVQKYGERFRSLGFGACLNTKLEDIAPFLDSLPRLSILDLYLSPARPPCIHQILYPAGSEIPDLSSVRKIRISPSLYSHEEDFDEPNKTFLRQVFKAASSSELRIECLRATYEILSELESAGKLKKLSVMSVAKDEDGEDDRVSKLLSNESPALTKLDFDADGCISPEGLTTLLISSKETLKELRLVGICPSEFSFEGPVLAKLTTLSLVVGRSCECIFQGRQADAFPALQELKLEFRHPYEKAKMSDGLFIVPSLKKIDLDGHVDKSGIEDLARCFPNVIEIRLNKFYYDFERSWDSDPTDIWSVGSFKSLEKLKIWDYTVKRPTQFLKKNKSLENLRKFKPMNMDSFLTGIPLATCENLRKQNQPNLTDPPVRESPSLFQLKNLKELIICVKLEDGLKKLPEEPPFISMVSVWYALQVMSNLEAKFVYEYDNRPPSRLFDPAETLLMLKAAFKHVQPYVELEPFVY